MDLRGGGRAGRGALYHNERLLEHDPKEEGDGWLTGWMEGRCDSIWWMPIPWGGRFSRIITASPQSTSNTVSKSRAYGGGGRGG